MYQGVPTFDWNRARGFLATAESGSLSAAARALGMTQPTLGRQVSALEDELGVALFERVGRGLVLTPAGQELLEQVRAMGTAADRVSMIAAGKSLDMQGVVRIAASEAFSAWLLPPVVAALRAQETGIGLDIVAGMTASDLARREADIALRNFRPSGPDLVARRLKDIPFGLYASPAYLRRARIEDTPHSVSGAGFVGFDQGEGLAQALSAFGLRLGADSFPVRCTNQLVQWEMVRQGLGIGLMPIALGDTDTGLSRVLGACRPLQVPLWLVAHRDLKASRRIRFVYDMLAERLDMIAQGQV